MVDDIVKLLRYILFDVIDVANEEIGGKVIGSVGLTKTLKASGEFNRDVGSSFVGRMRCC